jgi:hypothetical protein
MRLLIHSSSQHTAANLLRFPLAIEHCYQLERKFYRGSWPTARDARPIHDDACLCRIGVFELIDKIWVTVRNTKKRPVWEDEALTGCQALIRTPWQRAIPGVEDLEAQFLHRRDDLFLGDVRNFDRELAVGRILTHD